MLKQFSKKITLMKLVLKTYLHLFAFGILSIHSPSNFFNISTIDEVNDTLAYLTAEGEKLSGEARDVYNVSIGKIKGLVKQANEEKWNNERISNTFNPIAEGLSNAIEQAQSNEKAKALQLWEDLFYGKPVDEKDLVRLVLIDPVNIINALAATPSDSIFNGERLLAIMDKYPEITSVFNLSIHAIQDKMKEFFNLEDEFFFGESEYFADVSIPLSVENIFKKFIKYMTDKRQEESTKQKEDGKKDDTNEEKVESDNPPVSQADNSNTNASDSAS